MPVRILPIIDQVSEARKQRLDQRLGKHNFPDDPSQPMLRGGNLHIELAERSVGTAHGGLALVQRLVRELGLAQSIDERPRRGRRSHACASCSGGAAVVI